MLENQAELIDYLKSILYDRRIKEKPEGLSQVEGLEEIDSLLRSLRKSLLDLGRGNLSEQIEGQGFLIGTAKNLQSTLKSLTWHSKAISSGDFSQEVIFLGEFSEAFNFMTENIGKMFRELEASEKRHRLLADNASDVVWTMDLKGNLTYISPSVEKIIGYGVEEVKSMSREDILSPTSFAKVEKALREGLANVRKNLPFQVFREDVELINKESSFIWADLTISAIYDSSGTCLGILGVLKDITDRKKMEDRIKTLSETDRLTQINNRLKLDESLKIEMKRFLRGGPVFSIILLDIDYFKKVNDNFGHLVGDMVLIDLARLLSSSIRETDILGRWGGEEFLIITPITEADYAQVLAEKLREKVSNHYFPQVGHLTASFGVADSKGLKEEDELISRADLALYESKNAGRNKVSIYK